MTYQVWWSSLLMTCILFHFFSYFTDPGLSSVTTMTLSGQATVLAVLRRHCCYFSPTVRTLWAIMFLKSPFPRFSPVSKLAGALLLFVARGNQCRASSTETVSVSPSWTASFNWRMRKSYAAKQSSRLDCFTQIWQLCPQRTNFFDSFK